MRHATSATIVVRSVAFLLLSKLYLLLKILIYICTIHNKGSSIKVNQITDRNLLGQLTDRA